MMIFKKILVSCVIAIAAIYSLKAYAQQPPPSARTGAVEQELEKEPLPPEPRAPAPILELEKPEKELAVPEGSKVYTKEITLEGNTVFTYERLKRVTASYEGRELSFKEINEMARAIEDIYHKAGYFLASVYIPEQEIKEGVLKIIIAEGRLGKVIIQADKHYSQEFIGKHFHATIRGILHYGRLIKSLMLLNENIDCDVRATLARGEEPGTTDIVLKVEDKLPFHMYYDFNNLGSRYISKRRQGIVSEYGNLLFDGDVLSFRGIMGDPFNRLKFAKGEYGFFLNSYGTKLKLSYDWLEFDSIREYAIFDASGKSKVYGANITQPLIRTRNTTMDAGIGFDYKQVYDYLLSEINSDDELRVLKLKFSYDHLDSFFGRNFISGIVSFGFEDIMGALKKDDMWASRSGAGGEFTKLNLSLTRVQKVPFSSFVIFKTQGQYASDDLVIPEEFAIGGADSVRGYPVSEYLGDDGYTASLELRTPPWLVQNFNIPFLGKKFKDIMQFVFFVDHGEVYYKHYSFGERRHHKITGTGAGIRLNLPWDMNLQIDCGIPIGSTEPSDGANTHLYIQFNKKLF